MDYNGLVTAQGTVYFLSLHCSGSRVLFKGPVGSVIRALPRSKLLMFSGALQGQTQMGCAFCALPRSTQLRQRGGC